MSRIDIPADTPAWLKVLLWPFVAAERVAERLIGGPLSAAQMILARVVGGVVLLALAVLFVRVLWVLIVVVIVIAAAIALLFFLGSKA